MKRPVNNFVPFYARQEEMDEIVVKFRATSGVFILGVRRVLAQLILTLGNILLARILFPEIIGTFTILNFFILFFCVLSDLGLGQALVQKKKRPTLSDMRSVFTTHLLLSTSSFIVMYFVAPLLISIYGGQLESSSVFYLRFLSVSLFFLNLRKVSVFLLERELRFVKLSIAEVLEILTIQVLTIVFALNGWGIASYIYGVVIGRFIGMVILYLLFPWPIGLSLSFRPVKKLLRFGLPLQINTVIGFVNGALAPLYIGLFPGPGGYTGVEAVGYLTWAGGIALASQAISEVVQRIVFPAVSRFQDNMSIMRSVVRRSVLLTSFLSFPFIGVMIGLASPMTYIVYTDKWLPGLAVLYILLCYSVVSVLWVVFTSIYFGLGLSKQVRNINLLWVFVQWALTVPLVMRLGFVGFAWGQLFSSIVLVIPIRFLKKHLSLSLSIYVLPYLLLSIVSGTFVYYLDFFLPIVSVFQLVVYAFAGGLVYLVLVFIFKRQDLMENVGRVRFIVSNNNQKASL